jgi:hypothetical protein
VAGLVNCNVRSKKQDKEKKTEEVASMKAALVFIFVLLASCVLAEKPLLLAQKKLAAEDPSSEEDMNVVVRIFNVGARYFFCKIAVIFFFCVVLHLMLNWMTQSTVMTSLLLLDLLPSLGIKSKRKIIFSVLICYFSGENVTVEYQVRATGSGVRDIAPATVSYKESETGAAVSISSTDVDSMYVDAPGFRKSIPLVTFLCIIFYFCSVNGSHF